MNTYRKRLIIKDPGQVVLSDVPFQPGQEVEVTLRPTAPVSEDQKDRLRLLLKKTQNLPQIQTLTEDDIIAEIEAYRDGQ